MKPDRESPFIAEARRRRHRGKAIQVQEGREKHWPADRVQRRDPASYQRASEILIRLCTNRYCRHWTPIRKKHCIICHQPLPSAM